MKTRSDFVTNSSSSSFVISKSDSTNSVEQMFQLVKKYYLEWLAKKEEVIEYCKLDNRFEVNVDEHGHPTVRISAKIKGEARWKLNEMLEKMFGLCLFGIYNHAIEWMKCETYQEYISASDKDFFHPFTILDFRKNEQSKDDIYAIEEVIRWYFPSWDERFDEDGNERQSINADGKTLGLSIPEEFGNVCVFSEDNYMPDYVEKALGKHCEYTCRHMG